MHVVITLEFVNVLMGLMMAGIAIVNLRDRASKKRYNNAAFWGIYAITFLAGSYLPNFVNGLLVIAMVLIVAIGKLGPAPPEQTSRADREVSAAKWGNRLFIPALTIPAVALLGTFTLKGFRVNGVPLVDPKQVTLAAGTGSTVVLDLSRQHGWYDFTVTQQGGEAAFQYAGRVETGRSSFSDPLMGGVV